MYEVSFPTVGAYVASQMLANKRWGVTSLHWNVMRCPGLSVVYGSESFPYFRTVRLATEKVVYELKLPRHRLSDTVGFPVVGVRLYVSDVSKFQTRDLEWFLQKLISFN